MATTDVNIKRDEKVHSILVGALDVLETYGWLKGQHGDKGKGFCAVGAVWQAEAAQSADHLACVCTPVANALDSFVPERFKRHVEAASYIDYNDAEETTYEDIKALFEKAIEATKPEENA